MRFAARREIGATGNSMFKLKGPGMKTESRNYATNFPLEHALKDMDFAQALGDKHGVDMAASAAATSMFLFPLLSFFGYGRVLI